MCTSYRLHLIRANLRQNEKPQNLRTLFQKDEKGRTNMEAVRWMNGKKNTIF